MDKRQTNFTEDISKKRENIKYIVLPSSSSANTRNSFDEKCESWRKIFTKLG